MRKRKGTAPSPAPKHQLPEAVTQAARQAAHVQKRSTVPGHLAVPAPVVWPEIE